MSFQRMSGEEKYHHVLGACDWHFRLRVQLVDGTEVPGEYVAFHGQRFRALTIWDENGAEINIPARQILDVLPPHQPVVGCI